MEPESEIERVDRLYAALGQVNRAIVRMPEREELLREACRILVMQGGFRAAWIGWHEPGSPVLTPVAVWGDENGYLQHEIKIFVDGRPESPSPTGTAFNTGRPYVCNDTLTDPSTLLWRSEVERYGVRACAVFPIRRNGEVCATLTVYASMPGFFQDKEIALLLDVSSDLSFALDNCERVERQKRAEAAVTREKTFNDAMLESLPGILYFYNEERKFLRWNRNFPTVTGYSDEQIASMHPLDFFEGGERSLLAQKIQEVFERGEASVEADIVAQNGVRTPYFLTGRRLRFEGMNCLVGMGIDITVRKRAEVELAAYAKRLQDVSHQLLYVQENERRALARDLHDSVGQELAALSLNLTMIHDAIAGQVAPAVRVRLVDSQKLLEDTTQHLRDVMVELRPPGIDEFGLLAVLREHVQKMVRRSGQKATITGREPQPALPPNCAIALFRIAQEALNNTVKHAEATEITLELRQEADLVRMIVADNGRGFDIVPKGAGPSGGMGMTTMRERAEALGGHLAVQSARGEGTRVCVEVSLSTQAV
jgi:PAS domain S-box-containing protein